MKGLIKKVLPHKIYLQLKNYSFLFRNNHLESYAQDGEDLLLNRFIGDKEKGFYVDVGACHPKRFSNTYFFYQRGWRGINIDATPGYMDLFKIFRKRDINLEIPISRQSSILDFYLFEEPALNTFSKRSAEDYINSGTKLIKTIRIGTKPLSRVLDSYLPEGQRIDFMSVDAEGLDLEVLESNNWDKYKPAYVLVEELGFQIDKCQDSAIYNFLVNLEYKLVAKTFNTLFFKLEF